MARIVELTYPDNVTLVAGAVQNWVDLPTPAAATPLLHRLVEALPATAATRCLVVGPHDPALLRRLAERVGDLTVVVRSIPDAAAIGTDLPDATVLCGNLADARQGRGTYDLVVALDDVTRLLSLEDDQHRSWQELADEVLACVAPGGTLAMGIENELGLHRTAAPADPRLLDDDANWSPLATWDATRPRTAEQVEAFRSRTGLTGTTYRLFPTWQAPTVGGNDLERAARPLRDLLPALAARPVGDAPAATGLLAGRALAMADRYPDACAGWVLALGPVAPVDAEPALHQALADGRTAHWTVAGDQVRRGSGGTQEPPVAVPPQGRTLLLELVEAATDSDTPRMRAILTGWRRRLEGLAVDGVLPAAYADARFGNLLSGTSVTDHDIAVTTADHDNAGAAAALPLDGALAPVALDVATWMALADLYTTWRVTGVRHPWPSSMHPQSVFEALVAMAGAPAPSDPSRWVAGPDPAAFAGRAQTRQELLAVIERQEEELRGAWSRFHWDEKDYLVYKASKLGKRATAYVRREGPRRTLRRLWRLLKH